MTARKAPAEKPPEQPVEKMTPQEYFKGFMEAPASSVVFINFEGADVQITLRDWSESQLLKRVGRLLKTYPAAKAVKPTQQNAGRAPQGNSFVVTGMTIEIKDQKTYAKLRGGNFTQHGVRVWPEPLIEAGIIQDAEEFEMLDPRNPPDLSGWTAIYETKPGGNGHATPTKVVKLIAP